MPAQNQTVTKTSKDLMETKEESAKLAKSNDTPFSERPFIIVAGTIIVPLLTALASCIIAGAGAFFSWTQFMVTADQEKIDNYRKELDSINQARVTKEEVLTDYGKVISDLMIKTEEGIDDEHIPDEDKKNIARGQTLIALRRLNPDENRNTYNSEVEAKSEVEAGELKGLLIRYLYDLRQVGYYDPDKGIQEKADVALWGADIQNSVMEDAWLPGLDLAGAWLSHSNFREANLFRANLAGTNLAGADLTSIYLAQANLFKANLTGANLTGANLTGADLTGADLTGVDLRWSNLANLTLDNTILVGACYVEGTKAKYFPSSFDPDKHGMVAIPEDKSNPSKSNFQPCITL
ncbi:MAG: pentapeptide repeat-containing protein [Cyanobacteria bacterium P01_G01_bin.54]